MAQLSSPKERKPPLIEEAARFQRSDRDRHVGFGNAGIALESRIFPYRKALP